MVRYGSMCSGGVVGGGAKIVNGPEQNNDQI